MVLVVGNHGMLGLSLLLRWVAHGQWVLLLLGSSRILLLVLLLAALLLIIMVCGSMCNQQHSSLAARSSGRSWSASGVPSGYLLFGGSGACADAGLGRDARLGLLQSLHVRLLQQWLARRRMLASCPMRHWRWMLVLGKWLGRASGGLFRAVGCHRGIVR